MFVSFTGTLIHYNSPGLSDLYFVDPPWLYEVLSSVVPLDYTNSAMWDRGTVSTHARKHTHTHTHTHTKQSKAKQNFCLPICGYTYSVTNTGCTIEELGVGTGKFPGTSPVMQDMDSWHLLPQFTPMLQLGSPVYTMLSGPHLFSWVD